MTRGCGKSSGAATARGNLKGASRATPLRETSGATNPEPRGRRKPSSAGGQVWVGGAAAGGDHARAWRAARELTVRDHDAAAKVMNGGLGGGWGAEFG
ncbi:hypothetical protein Rhe02_97550 [Rhizocola hellebori]|uniref:Uncharacterized protein n=1 Tax=Rhizocola hellebori TaxID=1392758 RepID=A0A8J3QIU0_9ACTN|nr:hypothetical protein Rhe02_97550 [Rhizocola hellebori]